MILHSKKPREYTLINKDWYGNKLDYQVGFKLYLDADYLNFEIEVNTPVFYNKSEQQTFIAELWKRNVAELFISNGKSYIEFNLAPSGAWWDCGFTDYRKEDSNYNRIKSIQTTSFVLENSWHASLKFLSNDLSFDLTTASANICFILGVNNDSFLSYTDTSTAVPDFHLSKQFEKIKLK